MIRRTSCLMLLALVVSTGDARSPIKQDEQVIFFPTYGWQTADGTWRAQLHGWVFEPETDSVRRRAALEVVRRAVGLDAEALENQLFQERARAFLVDNERGKTIQVQIVSGSYMAGTSGANGHFTAEVALTQSGPLKAGLLDYQARLQDSDRRVFAGQIHLLAPTGISVISDIDDTIKDSQVHNKRELLANTFTRDFKPVPKMAAAYQLWQQAGVQFHYVSGSPWQLYEPLSAFLATYKFPAGSMHLRHFRVKDRSVFGFMGAPRDAKLASIEPLLKTFPKRQFILVGDSGEQDPEVYAAVARKFPEQVRHIFIRNVTKEPATAERYRQTFENLPQQLWTVFDDPQTLADFRP